MGWKWFTILNIIWCACVVVKAYPSHLSHATSEQKFIKYFNKNEEKIITRGGAEKSEHHEEYVNTYPSYEFSYKIVDPYSYDIKGQQEKRHGDKVNGDYWLIEPDGRKRIVKYHANDKIGFKVLIDYLKKERRPIQIKDQESVEEVQSAEQNEETSEAKPVSGENNNNNVENESREQNNNNESEEREVANESEEREEMLKKTNRKSNEQKSTGEVKNSESDTKAKKIRHRPHHWRKQNTVTDTKNEEVKSQEPMIVKVTKNSTGNRKDWSMKKEKSKEENSKNENKKNKEMLVENNKWHNENKMHARNKGYEVVEVINEDGGNDEQEINQDDAQTTEESTGKSEVDSKENDKVESSENKNKEEIYGYNTFIYHTHH